jgi:hypothetical protein
VVEVVVGPEMLVVVDATVLEEDVIVLDDVDVDVELDVAEDVVLDEVVVVVMGPLDPIRAKQ